MFSGVLQTHIQTTFLILDFYRGINIVFWFWGFRTVCEVNLLTTFRKRLWVPSSLVMSHVFRNVVIKLTSHTVQKPQNQKQQTTFFSVCQPEAWKISSWSCGYGGASSSQNNFSHNLNYVMCVGLYRTRANHWVTRLKLLAQINYSLS